MTLHQVDIFYAARIQFVDRIFEYVQTIETAKKALIAGQNPMAALDSIVGVAHKITGVAGTLGFDEVGQLAAAAEQKIRSILATDGASSVGGLAHWHQIEPSLEPLLNGLETLLDNQP
ncbi:MAG: Hpt domain-containing protein [Cypionkella sp.]